MTLTPARVDEIETEINAAMEWASKRDQPPSARRTATLTYGEQLELLAAWREYREHMKGCNSIPIYVNELYIPPRPAQG